MGIPMEQAKGIWVVAELTEAGELSAASLEAMSAAKALATQNQQEISAVLMSSSVQDTSAAEAAMAHAGADQVYSVKHELLAPYQAELYTAALVELIQSRQPNVVLMSASPTSRDFFPRVAARLQTGLITDAVALSLGGEGHVEVTRPTYAENLLSTVAFTAVRPQMITVRPKAFPRAEADTSRAVNSETVSPSLSADMARTKLVEVQKRETKTGKKLEEAEIIVTGGRGLKGPENFSLVEDLAQALGGAVGASRAVVDAGWRPHAEQVGQTGKTVSPQLYFALGISGAIQHQVGMSSSRIIVAINKDADAPIFQIADFGIVGDVFEVAPVLTKTIKEQNLAATV